MKAILNKYLNCILYKVLTLKINLQNQNDTWKNLLISIFK